MFSRKGPRRIRTRTNCNQPFLSHLPPLLIVTLNRLHRHTLLSSSDPHGPDQHLRINPLPHNSSAIREHHRRCTLVSKMRIESSRAEPSQAEPSRVNPSIESLPKRRNTIGLPEQHNTFVQSETAMYPCLSQTRGQSVKAESSWLNDTANHRSRSTV